MSMPNVCTFPATLAEVSVAISADQAKMLRRMCYFNKTIREKVTMKDGAWAGEMINDFMQDLGNQLKAEGYGRNW